MDTGYFSVLPGDSAYGTRAGTTVTVKGKKTPKKKRAAGVQRGVPPRHVHNVGVSAAAAAAPDGAATMQAARRSRGRRMRRHPATFSWQEAGATSTGRCIRTWPRRIATCRQQMVC